MLPRHRFLPFALSIAGAALIVVGSMRAESSASQALPRPSEDWAFHLDALAHFPGDTQMVAHHWCKPVSGGLIECQIYDSDAADARLVGIEVISDAASFAAFDKEEQALWHSHGQEAPAVTDSLPDLLPEVIDGVEAGLQETYGKTYLFWDPSAGDLPVGQPGVVRGYDVAPVP